MSALRSTCHQSVMCGFAWRRLNTGKNVALSSGWRSHFDLHGRNVHTVVMLRHGQSTWNLEKRFTGWIDVPLTEQGEGDAADAGRLIGNRGLEFDVCFTSELERAWRTAALVLAEAGQSNVETLRSWRLNERHYGMLQGHLKDSPELTDIFGEDQIIEWRRSYHNQPPTLNDTNMVDKLPQKIINHSLSYMNPLQSQDVNPLFPTTESLKDCEARAFGYWKEVIGPRVKMGERILIVAHANTIRALVKAIDNIGDEGT